MFRILKSLLRLGCLWLVAGCATVQVSESDRPSWRYQNEEDYYQERNFPSQKIKADVVNSFGLAFFQWGFDDVLEEVTEELNGAVSWLLTIELNDNYCCDDIRAVVTDRKGKSFLFVTWYDDEQNSPSTMYKKIPLETVVANDLAKEIRQLSARPPQDCIGGDGNGSHYNVYYMTTFVDGQFNRFSFYLPAKISAECEFFFEVYEIVDNLAISFVPEAEY